MLEDSFPVKLILSKNSNKTWNKFVINLINDEIVVEYIGIPLLTETKEYFDYIISQCSKTYNIVEVERFI